MVVGHTGFDSPCPVFLVGFPRSGTTLMEQILAAHPQIAVSDERPVLPILRNELPALTGHAADYPQILAELSTHRVGGDQETLLGDIHYGNRCGAQRAAPSRQTASQHHPSWLYQPHLPRRENTDRHTRSAGRVSELFYADFPSEYRHDTIYGYHLHGQSLPGHHGSDDPLPGDVIG